MLSKLIVNISVVSETLMNPVTEIVSVTFKLSGGIVSGKAYPFASRNLNVFSFDIVILNKNDAVNTTQANATNLRRFQGFIFEVFIM